MFEIILTDGDHRVVANLHADAESPRWGAEIGTMVCAHYRYTLGDEHTGLVAEVLEKFSDIGVRRTIAWLREEHGVTVILPLYLTDHSGLSIRAGENLADEDAVFEARTGWDTSFVGAIFATAANVAGFEAMGIEEMLRAEVDEYDLYLRGEVYLLSVQEQVERTTITVTNHANGTVQSGAVTEDVWVPLAGEPTVQSYGDTHLGEIAAEMLAEVIAPRPAVIP